MKFVRGKVWVPSRPWSTARAGLRARRAAAKPGRAAVRELAVPARKTDPDAVKVVGRCEARMRDRVSVALKKKFLNGDLSRTAQLRHSTGSAEKQCVMLGQPLPRRNHCGGNRPSVSANELDVAPGLMKTNGPKVWL